LACIILGIAAIEAAIRVVEAPSVIEYASVTISPGVFRYTDAMWYTVYARGAVASGVTSSLALLDRSYASGINARAGGVRRARGSMLGFNVV